MEFENSISYVADDLAFVAHEDFLKDLSLEPMAHLSDEELFQEIQPFDGTVYVNL